MLVRLASQPATASQLGGEVSQSSDLLSSSVLSKSSCMHLCNVIPGITKPCTAVSLIMRDFAMPQ